MMGIAGTIPNDIDGFIIPDEKGTLDPLGPYDNQTLILSVPLDKPDLRAAKWLSIWSEKIKISLAHTLFPPNVILPPSLDTIGVEPESTLNCEMLDDDLGLELRWTISGQDVILQLVSNTGNDRYLALGIRDPMENKGIAGDVVVGWISSKTGKGGLDDYFLAGKRIKCEDGAESCPDKSKGGTKDVELLNAVSRANYTMLTLRRPLKSFGDFDVDVQLDEDQFLFWSVGYKSAAMRKIHKPLKNQGPIQVNFGRKPRWNCQEKSDSKSVTSSDEDNVDVPRRRTTSVLTPAQEEQPQRVFRRPQRPKQPTRRNKPPSNTWNDWLSPPTRPEISQGFVPKNNVSSLSNTDWSVPSIGCGTSASKPLYIQLGPATPRRGNQGIDSPEGTALYVNGLLTPELTLVRGQEYTFVIETGLGTDARQVFHPLYITDDSIGGRQTKTESEARLEKVYAGVTLDRSGSIVPSAMGKLCRWSSPRSPMTYASFKDFHRSLVLKCEEGPSGMASLLKSTYANNPSVLKFVPDNTMPDVLYYQSFMAKRLGGKIHLKDYCFDSQPVPKDIVTYRPDILEHFGGQRELLNRAESRRKSSGNRRIDYDEDAYDYDYNDFDNEMDLLNKCKRRAVVKGRSLDNVQDMPRFEHFPMRDIAKMSGIDEDLPTDIQCREFLKSEEQKEKEKVYQSLLKTNTKTVPSPTENMPPRSDFGGRVNPNQKRTVVRTQTTRRPPVFRQSTIGPILTTSRKPNRTFPTMQFSTTKVPSIRTRSVYCIIFYRCFDASFANRIK